MAVNEQATCEADCFPVAAETQADLRLFVDAPYASRLYNPLDDTTATDRLLSARERWRDEGVTVVFTSGVYDVMHFNNRIFLLATKLAGVAARFTQVEAGGDPDSWRDLDSSCRQEYAAHALGNGLVRQVVSVDGDDAVAQRKGFSEAKGNMARPIYGWQSRARDVLSTTVPLLGSDSAHSLADAVTLHDRTVPELADTPHAGILEIGLAVRPEVWGIYHESTDIINGLLADRASANLSGTIEPVVILHSDGVFHDDLLGGPFSTTALARRIGSATN